MADTIHLRFLSILVIAATAIIVPAFIGCSGGGSDEGEGDHPAGTNGDAVGRTRDSGASGPSPILFVHGWHGYAGDFATYERWFKRDGWPGRSLKAVEYNSAQSSKVTAGLIATEVSDLLSQTGAAEIDIITHSMGGLPTRWYLKLLGGTARVDAWVSLAGPNHGTKWAYSCDDKSCLEMRPRSAFLNELNAIDETPGGARYGTWRSRSPTCETVILPSKSTVLSGASLNKMTDECIGHGQFLTNERVYEEVRKFVLAGS